MQAHKVYYRRRVIISLLILTIATLHLERDSHTAFQYGICRNCMFIVTSLHAKGTFMCPHNTSVLRDGHVYVPADIVQSNGVYSEAKRAFGVNPRDGLA